MLIGFIPDTSLASWKKTQNSFSILLRYSQTFKKLITFEKETASDSWIRL